MRGFTFSIRSLGILLFSLVLTAALTPLFGQYREYYIYGVVVDLQKQPVPDVELVLREKSTSRSYSFKTNKKGEFKFVGLPHGIYGVEIRKQGYQPKTDEWKFEATQDQMVKAQVPDITLVTENQLKEIHLNQKLEAEFKNALEYLKNQDYDGTIAVLQKMLELKKDDANALYLLGVAYNKKKMYAEALEVLNRVILLNPGFAGTYYQLGIAYHQLNQLDPALQNYLKTLELDTDRPDIRFNTGLLLFQQNKPGEALAQFEKGLQLKADDPELLEMAGRCCIQLENYARAVEYLEKAKALTADAEKIKFFQELIDKLKPAIKK